MWVSSAHARKLRSTKDLDGLYLTLGPVASVTHIEDSWFVGAGAEVSVVLVAERRLPAGVGLSFGGISYDRRDGGRLWLEAETAINKPLPFAIGLAAGASAEVDPVRPPRWGAQATLWVFAGVVPYLRIGVVEDSGAWIEAGIMIKMPVKIID